MEKELFSLVQAAKYLNISANQMKNEVNYRRSIKPAKKRQRVFTRAQLDDWLENGGHTSIEANGELMDTAEAAAYLGVTIEALKQLYHIRQAIPGEMLGNTVIYYKGDLDEYKAEREPIQSPVPVSDAVPEGLKENVRAKLERQGVSFYALIAKLWQQWLDDKRTVPSMSNSPQYRAIPKEGVFARVEESLREAVDAKCKHLSLRRSWVTAQLLGQWLHDG